MTKQKAMMNKKNLKDEKKFGLEFQKVMQKVR